MVNAKLAEFIDLVRFDQEILQQKKKIELATRELESLRQKKDSEVAQLEKTNEYQLDMRKKVETEEQLMKEMDQQLKKQKKRLDEANNEKEYKAIKLEIDALEAKQGDLESQLVFAWHALEQAENDYEKKQLDTTKQLSGLESVIKEKISLIKQMSEDLQNRIKKRNIKVASVHKEWVDRYDDMVKRVDNPVVPIEHDSCTACFYMLSSEDRITLNKHALLQCKGCYRFLYMPQDMIDQKNT